jgi:hypothetical protein
MKRTGTYIRWTAFAFLLACLLLNIYLLLQGYHVRAMRIAVLDALLLILFTRNRLSWIAGVCIVGYGLFYELFLAVFAAVPGVMDYTSVLHELYIDTEIKKITIRILGTLPAIFHLLSFILFFTKPVLRYYYIIGNSNEPDSAADSTKKKVRYKGLIFLTVFFVFFQGRLHPIHIAVSDHYTGPCVVFMIPDSAQQTGNRLVVKNGLNVLSKGQERGYYTFTSIEKGSTIKIINSFREKEANDTDRYIFQPGSNTKTGNCDYRQLHFISFYVGRKADYLKWNKQYTEELVYFDSTGIDWCGYYKLKTAGR